MKYLRRNIIIIALLSICFSAIQADTVQSGSKIIKARRKLSSKSSKKSGGKSGKSESGHKHSHIIYLDGNPGKSKQELLYILEEGRSKGKSGKSSGDSKYLRVVLKPVNNTDTNSTNSSAASGSTKSLLSSSLTTLSSPASSGGPSWVGISLAVGILGALFL